MDRFYDDRLRLNRVTSSADALPFDYSYTDNSSRNLVDSVAQWVGTSTRYCRTYDYESQSDRLSALQHAWGTLAASIVDTRLAYDSVGLRSNESTAGSGLMASLGRTSGLCTDFAYTPRRELDTSGQYDLSAVWARGLAIASSLRAYGYDAIGNRLADQAGAYAANALNQYTSAPGIAALAYDLAGNLTSDGSRTYTYDGENRLASITQGGVTSTFKYDYLGRRISKNVGGAETRYLYDGWNLIAEIAPGSFAIQRSYTWGLDASGSLQGAGGVGGLLCIASGTSRYYPIYDGSFNVTGLYDGNGAIAAAYRYDPSGSLLQATGAAASLNAFGFSTKFTDRETGLIYYGLRYYHAAMGRFINRDPIEERGGLNLYGFCGNDGVNRWDYLGMSWLGDLYNSVKEWFTGSSDGPEPAVEDRPDQTAYITLEEDLKPGEVAEGLIDTEHPDRRTIRIVSGDGSSRRANGTLETEGELAAREANDRAFMEYNMSQAAAPSGELKQVNYHPDRRIMFIRLNKETGEFSRDRNGKIKINAKGVPQRTYDANSRFVWPQIFDRGVLSLQINNVISSGHLVQFRLAEIEPDVARYLREAGDGGYRVSLLSHGDTGDVDIKAAFGVRNLNVQQSFDKWNRESGYDILHYGETNWDSCDPDYGTREPEDIWNDTIRPRLERYFAQ